MAALPGTGDTVRLFVFTQVREDAYMTLYGFATRDERQTFAILLGAPKLGPKTALAMLELCQSVELAAYIT